MKIKVNHNDLSLGITKVISAINTRNTLPILSNLLMETISDNELRITGTDLELGITHVIPVEVIEKGAVTIPAKKFSDIIREAPEEEVEINITKNNSVNIKSGKAFFKLMGLPKDDYPKFPKFSLDSCISVDQKILKECFHLTTFAISSDETRYVLNGALIVIQNKEMKVVATDGRRLAVINKSISVSKSTNLEIIIPTKAINEVNKNIQEEGEVQIVEIGNQIVFNINKTTIISRLIEGHFPNYDQVIPTEEKIVTKIPRDKLLATIRRVSLLTSIDAQAVKVDLVKGNKMIISARSPNLGEAKEEIDAEIISGEEMTIGFNPVYLMDVLKNLDIEYINLHLTDPEKPGVIRGKEGYIYVIMPMQIT